MLLIRAFTTALVAASSALCYSAISDDDLRHIVRPGATFDIKTGSVLSPILVPRVPGTAGSAAVLSHIVSYFRRELPEWELMFQNSTSTTPVTGSQKVPFTNLIARRQPKWARPGEVGYLTLAAHFDSKLSPEGFIGATDSAAPVAMLMHAAKGIDAALTKKWASMKVTGTPLEPDAGVMLLFLDGEEAFLNWSHDDSLYGARSLAAAMEGEVHPATSTYHNGLSSINLFLLLDLLGSAGPRVPSYFKTTHWAYTKMAQIETRLRGLGLFKSANPDPDTDGQFLYDAQKGDDEFSSFMIEDDHIPFLMRGVEILHIIPTPFPRVWHEMDDDGEHLDMDTVEDWAVLVTAFAAEWMELNSFMPQATKQRLQKRAFVEEDVPVQVQSSAREL